MTRFTNQAFAALAALVLGLGSIGTIIIVPPAHAGAPAALVLPVIA